MTTNLGPGFCWTCGTPFTTSTALDAHQLDTGHEMDQPDHPLRTVTQYDIATNPQATTTYRTMDVREADANIRCARELGDTIREYVTTDRAGRPLRIVLHICTSIDGREDLGGVYEFTR